ncbi:MAG: pyridoxal-phosphate dependent enzyme [Candidatus Bathyarchaeia archaeon]
MKYDVECSACSYHSSNLLDFKCSSCGMPLDIQVHLDFETKRISKKDFSLWRYRRFFPYVRDGEIVRLGEGWTPLVRFSERVYFKLESLNPTGSFKDRGSALLVSALHKLVKKRRGYISEDSSGNAGASIAAYAARAGLRAKVYVPEAVAGPKFNQIQFYGADVVKVSGNRSKVAEEAQKPEPGKFYVGHILHPLFRDGIRSLAYEMSEQFGWKAPGCVYLPVSAGTLLLGVVSGFQHLVGSNVIESMPRIVACQTRQVSPLYHRMKNLSYTPLDTLASVADALVSVDPPLLELMVKNLKKVDGDAVIVEEEEILEAFRELAGRGFYVEPSSAVAYAGYKKQVKNKEVSVDSSAAIVLTGAGLKTATVRP